MTFSFRRVLSSAVVGLITFIVISFPAFGPLGVPQFFKVLKTNEDRYPYTSLNAYNLWSLDGMMKPDLVEGLFGLTYRQWGNVTVGILLLVSGTVLYFYARRRTHIPETMFLYASLCFFIPFITMTGMHERYLFPFFPFLIMYSALLAYRRNFSDYIFYLVVYMIMAIVHLVNLVYVYDLNYYTPLSYNGFKLLESHIFHLSLISVIIFSLFYVYSISKFIFAYKQNTD